MTTFPGSPKLLKAGIVLIAPATGQVQRVITLQYNPTTLNRTLEVQGSGAAEGARAEPLRLKGPAAETISLEAEIDAADQLEIDEDTVREIGIHPQLAALETMVHPTSRQLKHNNRLAERGTLEIVPMESALAVFVWSKSRVQPVRVTSLSITEEAFDPALNPIRAKVSLGLRVLSVDDLGFDHPGSSIFMNYLEQKERLAKRAPRGTFGSLGIGGV